MFSRIAIFLLAFCATVLWVNAAPTCIPANETLTTQHLEKRVTHNGRATFFYVGLGNCGKWNKDSDHIVALSTARYNSNGGYCDRWLSITNTANKKQVYAKVRDSCPPCGYDSLDLSPSAFSAIGSQSTGVLNVNWNFMPAGWHP